jgi:hypothetical protein
MATAEQITLGMTIARERTCGLSGLPAACARLRRMSCRLATAVPCVRTDRIANAGSALGRYVYERLIAPGRADR